MNTSEKTLDFKGKVVDIMSYCNNNCNRCLLSPICEFAKDKDLTMRDFLISTIELDDLESLNEDKINQMYKIVQAEQEFEKEKQNNEKFKKIGI